MSAADSRPANAGMTPRPLFTTPATVAASSPALSRFGPTAPVEPAALNVWQPPHPASAKTFAPDAAGALPAALAAGVAGLSAPISSGPTNNSTTTSAAASHVTGARTRSMPASKEMPDPPQRGGSDASHTRPDAGRRRSATGRRRERLRANSGARVVIGGHRSTPG